MRYFVDTANLDNIKAAFDLGIVSGVTTNPVIINNEHTHDIKGQLSKIRGICNGEIFTQVLGSTTSEMISQAKTIWSWDNNITVKIPLNVEGIKAVSALSKEGIRTCTTITFTPAQALAAALAGASYVALFVNRSHDIGYDGFQMVKTVVEIYRANNIKTQVLAASVSTPMDVVRAAQAGVDVVTAPYHTWEDMIKNQVTASTLESFLAGWTGTEIQ
jgi:transaldolase